VTAATALHDPDLDTPAAHIIALPNTAGWLSANDGRGGQLYQHRRHVIAAWRSAARDKARATKLPDLAAVRIIAELRFPDRRRRDPGNFYDTAKAAVDGLVDAGVIADDSAAYVLGPDMRLGPIAPGFLGILVLHLYPLQQVTT
jgi:hypothetical protein